MPRRGLNAHQALIPKFFYVPQAAFRAWAKYLFLFFGALLFSFLIGELLFRSLSFLPITIGEKLEGKLAKAFWNRHRKESLSPDDFFLDDKNLGFRLASNGKAVAELQVNSNLIFRETYTTNQFGNRAIPEQANPSDESCTLFFGDSFTFGHGVGDQETTAARFQKHAKNRPCVLNFGVMAYGPHHFLRILETNAEVPAIGKAKIKNAFFITISEHAFRIKCSNPWDFFGPKYLIKNNTLAHQGNFYPPYLSSVFFLLMESKLFSFGMELYLNRNNEQFSPDSIKLYQTILAKADELLKSKFGTPLTVIFWDTDYDSGPLINSLKEKGIEVIKVSDAIPRIKTHPEEFKIPFDGHPNAKAHDFLARFLASRSQ